MISAIQLDPQFRRMQVRDVDNIMGTENDVYQFPWSKQIFLDCIRVGYDCWLLLIGEEIAGHAVLSIAGSESHILNLSIARRCQNRGLGKQFVHFLEQQATHKHAQTILLEVRPSNPCAIQCYTACGFNQIGCRKNYYPTPDGKEDALLFAKQLNLGKLN